MTMAINRVSFIERLLSNRSRHNSSTGPGTWFPTIELRTMNLRHSLRSLARTPVVTIVAVLSMALGIGANVAIFSLFNQALLRPLPVPEPGRLVNLVSPGVRSGSVSCGGAGNCDSVFSYPMFRDLERLQT